MLANGVRFPMLRQQADHADSRPNRSLADFVAPAETGLADHVGAFAVTAGLGADELADRFAAEHDDYRSIMVKALADRLAEAFAEHLHEERPPRVVRGGRAALASEELIAESYRGIRPAFGYPACPDHSEKRTLFDLLEARAGRHRPDRELRHDSRARASPGSTSAIPAARYFAVGTARARPGRGLRAAGRASRCAEAERWLSPNLAYDPD